MLDHTFWPLMIQRSPSRTARVLSPARSDPAPGSLNSWHHPTRPSRIGGTRRSIWSGVPWVRMVGAAMSRPSPPGGRSAPAAAKVARTTAPDRRDRPRPPSSGWKWGAVQPALATMLHHSSASRLGSQCSSSHWFTSAISAALGSSVGSAI